jgi:hypothetical protein
MYGISTLCKHGWKILRTIPVGLSNATPRLMTEGFFAVPGESCQKNWNLESIEETSSRS